MAHTITLYFCSFWSFFQAKKSTRDLKIAKIIFVKKLDKLNYFDPNVFYLISFFLMLNKAIKAIIVEEISYWVEKHSLLLLNYYGALK